ncbi:MAG: hypothetical protein ACYTGB_05535 [Planctomycetota bacterium]|jgi:hypothetical protein
MSGKPEPKRRRRELLRDLARGALLGGLAGGAWLLLRGGRGDRAARHRCTGGGICRGCGSVPDCILPQAESFRKATRD